MKQFTFTLIALMISIFILAQDLTETTKNGMGVEYYKVSKVRVYVNDVSDIHELRKQGLGIDRIKFKEGYFDALLDILQQEMLEKSGYSYQIIKEDVTNDYLERTKESRTKIKKLKKTGEYISSIDGFGYGSMGGYYTFNEVVAELDNMYSLYPNIITEKDSSGASIEGRPIWTVKISDNPNVNEDEPEVFYNSLTHAREPNGMMTVMNFMYYLLENYGVNPEVTYLVENRELYFMPVINPDGYIYNETINPEGGGMWRKNRRANGDGTYGVDLNRNFGYQWGYDDKGSSPVTSNNHYRGAEAFSEPETQAIRDFCINHDFSVSANYHTYGNVVYSPWGYNHEQPPDSIVFNQLIKNATSLNGYRYGIFIPNIYNYPMNGVVYDWMYGETNEKNRIYGVLPEVGGDDDGDWPIPERIFPLAEENIYPNLVYAWGPGIIENPPYIDVANIYPKYPKYITLSDDSLIISAHEINPDSYNSIITAIIIDDLADTVDQIELKRGSTDLFSGKWSPNNDEEKFYSVVIKQSGIEKPSNFYYTDEQNLSYTTVGPISVDTIEIAQVNDMNRLKISKVMLLNQSISKTVPDVRCKITTDDTSITKITGSLYFFNLAPQESKAVFSPIYIDIDTMKSFTFIAEISSNNIVYWKDTIKYNPNPVYTEELENLPTEYVLHQNYPNPFNPSTTIKYSIPKRSNVTIKVYDLLGSEVIILVNKVQSQGNYEIEFDGSELTSGIYLYRIVSAKFVDTKKLILLK